jgi:hypothetical protein
MNRFRRRKGKSDWRRRRGDGRTEDGQKRAMGTGSNNVGRGCGESASVEGAITPARMSFVSRRIRTVAAPPLPAPRRGAPSHRTFAVRGLRGKGFPSPLWAIRFTHLESCGRPFPSLLAERRMGRRPLPRPESDCTKVTGGPRRPMPAFCAPSGAPRHLPRFAEKEKPARGRLT